MIFTSYEFSSFTQQNYLKARKDIRRKIQQEFNLKKGYKLPIGAIVEYAYFDKSKRWLAVNDEAQNAHKIDNAKKYKLQANLYLK